MDSLIRLRQVNQPELSGYITKVVFPALTTSGANIGGSFIPTGSGIYDLGSSAFPFRELYVKEITMPSGSGIWFGSSFFTAYTSGADAVLKINNITITSSPNGLSIVGPSGAIGPSGIQGPSGASGIGITGVTGAANNMMRLYFSNGTNSLIPLPTGVQGPTGVSVTGFSQNGNYISPMFSNATTGAPIFIPSGKQGERGYAGGINIEYSDFTGFTTGQAAPKAYIYNIDEQGFTYNPTIHLVRGMAYNFAYSGLNLSTVTITGNGIDYPTGNFKSNYFVESGITGYLKLCFFDPNVLMVGSNAKTGRYIRQEYPNDYVVDVAGYVNTSSLLYEMDESITKSDLFGIVKLSSPDSFKYGFQKYDFYTNQPIEDLGAWGFYVLGDVNVSYFGPAGPSGSQGPSGIAGGQGRKGDKGDPGSVGVSITGFERNGNDLRFLYSNGTYSAYTTMPAGGAQGPAGPTGPQGPQGPSGERGQDGAVGQADKYAASFYYWDTSYNGTGNSFYKRPSGTSSWALVTGNNRKFRPGDEVKFYNDAFKGKAYTAWQKLLFADTPMDRNQYFYASVNDYNSANGEISAIISDSPYPLGMVGGDVLWYNYNELNVNLGGLGSSGAMGPQGIQGIAGSNAYTGYSVWNVNNVSGLQSLTTYTLKFDKYDLWNLGFTGLSHQINFDYTTFQTGQTVMIRLHNSGQETELGGNSLVIWDANVKFPYGVDAPGPSPNTTSLYTFIRLPDEGINKRVFCTYSVNYVMS